MQNYWLNIHEDQLNKCLKCWKPIRTIPYLALLRKLKPLRSPCVCRLDANKNKRSCCWWCFFAVILQFVRIFVMHNVVMTDKCVITSYMVTCPLHFVCKLVWKTQERKRKWYYCCFETKQEQRTVFVWWHKKITWEKKTFSGVLFYK